MTRINLLPERVSKKKETVLQQAVVASVAVFGTAAVLTALYFSLVAKIKAAENEIANANSEIATLKKRIGQIDNLKKLQAEVRKKLDVLEQLRKEKVGPSRRFASLSDALPEKLWLTRYAETGEKVSMSGMSFSEELIAQFMKNLQGGNEFTNVELLYTEQAEVAGTKLKKFELTCSFKPAQIPRQEGPSPEKK